MKTPLLEQIRTEINPALVKELNIANVMQIPKVEKITINIGAGKALQDKSYIDHVVKTIRRITGQHPIITKARLSIASFKLREGMPIGVKVTLRGKRMYNFLDKLINVALPRVRDFRGLSTKSFDRHGNYSVGIKEHIIFPELSSDEVERIHGLEVVITTTAGDDYSAYKLLKLMGFPFNDEVVLKQK